MSDSAYYSVFIVVKSPVRFHPLVKEKQLSGRACHKKLYGTLLIFNSNFLNLNFLPFDQIFLLNWIWLQTILCDCYYDSDKKFSFQFYISLIGHFTQQVTYVINIYSQIKHFNKVLITHIKLILVQLESCRVYYNIMYM